MLQRLKSRKVILGLVIFFGLVFLFILLTRSPEDNLYVHDTGVTLKRSLTGSPRDNTVLVSTNRNLVKYDPQKGTTTTLMNDAALPQILNLSWSANESYALFQSSGQNESDQLGKILLEQNFPTKKNVWWVADFKSKQYKPLGEDIKTAGWIDGENFYTVGIPQGQTKSGLYRSAVEELEFTLVIQQDDLLAAYPCTDGYLLYSSVNKKGSLSKIGKRGGTPTQFLKDLSRPPVINRSGTVISTSTNTGPYDDDPGLTEDTLSLVDTKQGRVIKKLAEKYASSGYWSASGDAFYFENGKGKVQQIVRVDVQTEKNKSTAKVSPSTLKNLPQTQPSNIIPTTRGGLFLLDSQNKMYAVSSTKNDPVKPFQSDTVNGTAGIQGDGFAMYYYRATNVYGISLTGLPRETYKKRALDVLKKNGVNTTLADIIYDDEYQPFHINEPENVPIDE